MHLPLGADRAALEAFCRCNHIQEMRFFGSVLRDGFGPENDVDVRIRFPPDAQNGEKA